MKMLITGANGQLGQDMVKLCNTRNIQYTAADSKILDITNRKNVDEFIRTHAPEVIINCAAYNAVDLAEKEWKRASSVNGLGVKNLVLAANKYGSVLVHYSTDYVFNGKSERPYTIACTPHPISRYGESKLLGEIFLRDLCDRYFLIRTSWVFGKGNSNFAQKILDWSREKTQLSIVDDQISSPTYSVDLAKITLDLVQTNSFGLYHCTNSGTCSRYDWAQYILQQKGWKGILHRAKSENFKTAAQRPAYSALDNFGTEETLGYNLPSWQDATTRYMREIREIP
jgi:dTDP-4-dehydrorhamnose reductase